jgi:hypothetical protein
MATALHQLDDLVQEQEGVTVRQDLLDLFTRKFAHEMKLR